MLARRAAVLAVRSLQVQRGWSLDVAHRILQHWRPAADRSRRSQASADRSAGAAGAAAWAGSCSELGVPAAEAASIQPAVPLCERSGQHAVPLSDLLAWWEAAKQRVAAVGDSWVQQEPDGPTAADLEVGWGLLVCIRRSREPAGKAGLMSHACSCMPAVLQACNRRPRRRLLPPQTELGWLMDDCVAGMARAGKDWGSASWQQVERDVRTQGPLSQAACQYMVQLREPLDALGEQAWLRVQHGTLLPWSFRAHSCNACCPNNVLPAKPPPPQMRCGSGGCSSACRCSTSHPPPSGATSCCQVHRRHARGGWDAPETHELGEGEGSNRFALLQPLSPLRAESCRRLVCSGPRGADPSA